MAGFSINTNYGASVALAALGSIQTTLGKTEKQVSTGLKVADATDDAGVFAVAQGIRTDLATYDTINASLTNGQAVVSSALSSVTSISTLISQITGTLTDLSASDISDAQRVQYSSNLLTQITSVKTYILNSGYNNVNLLSGYTGTQLNPYKGDGFTVFAPGTSFTVLTGLGGQQLSISPSDILGGSAGTDGFLGLSRLVYYVATDTNGATATANDTIATAFNGYGPGAASGLIVRTEIGSYEALAALAALSNSGNAYITAAGTPGGPSVFGSAVAAFQAQVNSAMGALGASYNVLDSQITFVQSLQDTETDGLGNLVDANLATEAARLTALETQQNLASQSLSIANALPKNILTLFQPQSSQGTSLFAS